MKGSPANKVCLPAEHLLARKGWFGWWTFTGPPDLEVFAWRKAVVGDLASLPRGFDRAADSLMAVGESSDGKLAFLGERQWYGWPDEGRFAVVILELTPDGGGGLVTECGDYSALDSRMFGQFVDDERDDGALINGGIDLNEWSVE